MPLTEEVIRKVAEDTGISVEELKVSSLLAFLRDKKKKIMLERLYIFARYSVNSSDNLEIKIKNGEIAEHPAWEDLILLENLEAGIVLIDGDIKSIQVDMLVECIKNCMITQYFTKKCQKMPVESSMKSLMLIRYM